MAEGTATAGTAATEEEDMGATGEGAGTEATGPTVEDLRTGTAEEEEDMVGATEGVTEAEGTATDIKMIAIALPTTSSL